MKTGAPALDDGAYASLRGGRVSDGRVAAFRLAVRATVVVVATLAAVPAAAQDLTYEPVNPSFGGNPFNSSHLLGIANAQNNYRDPRSVANSSQSEIFARQLQSRLLSALSSQLVDAIFGENPQERGTITFGGQTIVFVRGIDSVTLTITNNETNEVTEIIIPTFVEVI